MATPPDTFNLESIRDLLKDFQPSPQQRLFLSRGYHDAINATFPVERAPESHNSLMAGSLSYMSIPVRTYDIPKQTVYDWSGCRSPSRAKRRYAKGIPQRVNVSEVDVAYLVNEDALRSFQIGWERMCAKILFNGSAT